MLLISVPCLQILEIQCLDADDGDNGLTEGSFYCGCDMCKKKKIANLIHVIHVKIMLCVCFVSGYEGEDVVLKAMVRWVVHSPVERLGDLPEVLRHVRLSCTSRECRKQQLLNNPVLQDSQGTHFYIALI
jgi:hypothetical protein